MKKLNLKSCKNVKQNRFGMFLIKNQETFIQEQIDLLRERSPSNARINLKLEKIESGVKGILTINSFSEKFYSTRIASNPVETYMRLQEDIDSQLLEWKRNRFSDSIFNKITPRVRVSENCA